MELSVFRSTFCLAAALTLLAPVPPAQGQEEPGEPPAKVPHRVPRVDGELELDGVLDDGVWAEALVLELAWEVRPGENVPPPVRTEVLLAYGESHLYAAFRAWDPDPASIVAHYTDRDSLYDDDWVVIILDTFNDERRTYDFFSNPLGIQGDGIESPDGEGAAWDAIWDSAGRITADGYQVEMAIPWSSLPFQHAAGDQIWGFDAVRSYPRAVRHHIGLFPRDRNNNCYMCQSEKLIGFAGATPGRNVELDPTVSALYSQQRAEPGVGPFVEREQTSEPGLTASWGFRPSLTLNAALNPDFSQVEADAAQLDVNTQFALFYPEKRPFFLAGADFFLTRLSAVHTRMVADPSWGLKVTGKQGPHAIGAFVAEDEITNLLLPGAEGSRLTSLEEDNVSAVLRYRRDLGRNSTVGMLVTSRQGDEYHNRLVGLDANLRVTAKDRVRLQWLGSRTRYPAAVAADYDEPEGELDGHAWDLFYLHDTRGLDWYAVYREVDPDFRADLGFMPQAGFKYREAGWGHTWNHDPPHWYNMLNFGSAYEEEEDFNGTMLQEGWTFWFNYAGPYRSAFNLNGAVGKEGFRGLAFDRDRIWFDAGLWPTGNLYLRLDAAFGDRIDYANARPGRQFLLVPRVHVKLGRHLAMTLEHTYERLKVDGGRLYEANVSQLWAVYQFTRRSFLRTIVQYVDYQFNPTLYVDEIDPELKRLFSQVLFSYKINPQTVLFVGYSDNHFGDHRIHLTQTDRTVFVKLGYAWVW